LYDQYSALKTEDNFRGFPGEDHSVFEFNMRFPMKEIQRPTYAVHFDDEPIANATIVGQKRVAERSE
jgi:hypothetical protein